jgi:hypothetical protein
MRASMCLSAMALMASVCSSALAGGATYSFAEPSIDRWMNPFNPTRGYRSTASTFGSIGVNIPGFNFDDRYSQLLVGFDLLTQAPAGLGVCRYKVTAARVTLTVSEDLAFKYDPTFDILSTYTTADDGDGRPMELFGVGYRNGWTSCRIDPSNAALSAFPCFYEGNAANPGPAFSATGQPNEDLRNVFASDNAGGVLRDVSNFVRDGLRVTPFAIGRIQGLASGALVPVDTDVTFDLDVENPDVQMYLKRAADTGLLRLMVASMHPASSQGGSGSGAFATFYCKEIGIPGLAARLTITIDILPVGDANGDGSVTFGDITTVLANFGTSGEGIPGDADCNGTVAFADVTAVLANFGN